MKKKKQGPTSSSSSPNLPTFLFCQLAEHESQTKPRGKDLLWFCQMSGLFSAWPPRKSSSVFPEFLAQSLSSGNLGCELRLIPWDWYWLLGCCHTSISHVAGVFTPIWAGMYLSKIWALSSSFLLYEIIAVFRMPTLESTDSKGAIVSPR